MYLKIWDSVSFLYVQAQVQIPQQLDIKYLDNQVNVRHQYWQVVFYTAQSINLKHILLQFSQNRRTK